MNPTQPQTNNLTPNLNVTQMMQNIDAMKKQSVPTPKIQEYVNNYQKGSDGTYSLKGANKGVLGNIGDEVKNDFNDMKSHQTASMEGKENPLSAGLNEAKNVTDIALSPLNQTVGKVMSKVTNPIVKAISDKLGNTQAASELAALMDKHPDLGNALSDLTQTGLNVGTMATLGEGAEKAPEAIKQGVDAIKENIPNPLEEGQKLLQGAKEHLSEKNIEPQLESSAKRVENPVDTYNEFSTMAKKAVSDVKADPPLAKVGEDIGNAFQKVVKMRQGVGKTMGDELKSFGNKAVSVKNSIGDFQKQLIDNGSSYDSVSKEIKPSETSKFSKSDNSILENYASELQGLGKNPTAAKVDAFISRIPKEIEGLKAEKGINFATNAERIIKGNLSSLRESLGEVATDKYNAARKQYSDLSQFMEEGGNYLGKKTQSGDFAKDASMAKSSVTSLLNNGKKDWMAKLEGLTGYKALDNSVMALQAMKDAGDARGTSLLQHLSESVPHTSSGFIQKLIDFGIGKAKKTLVGSPEEQTRTFLQSLSQKK